MSKDIEDKNISAEEHPKCKFQFSLGRGGGGGGLKGLLCRITI